MNKLERTVEYAVLDYFHRYVEGAEPLRDFADKHIELSGELLINVSALARNITIELGRNGHAKV